MKLIQFTRSAACLALLCTTSQALTQGVQTRALGALSTNDVLVRARDLPPNAGFVLPLFDEPGDGALWVLGENFKARFDRRGLEFIPFLGSDAPKDVPLDFTVASARVGERELAWSSDVEPERDGSIVTYHRGAFDEVFDIGCDSIEHSFVIGQRVSGGELDIQVRVEGELERSSDALGASFFNERGGVRYGRATLVDARGTRLASATHLVGDSIEIRAPQIELERAEYPLTVDPVISTFGVSGTSNTPELPDTSYDLTTNTWLCVYQQTYSATDHDIIAAQLSGSGALLFQVPIDFTSANWTKPRVANNNAQHQFMVVSEVNVVYQALPRIFARTFSATTRAMGSQFSVSPPPITGQEQYSSPDIGGDDYPVGSPAYCVAYRQVGNSVWCSRVSPGGIVFPGVQLLEPSSNEGSGPVHISKSNGHWSYGNQRWTVGWQWLDVAILLRQVDLAGQPTGSWVADLYPTHSSFSISPLLDEYGPARRFLIANIDGDTYVRGSVWSMDASGTLASQWGSPVFSDTNYLVKTSVTAETDGSRFYVAYTESSASGADSNVYMETIANVGGNAVLTQSHVPIATNSFLSEGQPSLASKHSSGSSSPDAMCAWKRFAGVVGGHGGGTFYPDAIFGTLFY